MLQSTGREKRHKRPETFILSQQMLRKSMERKKETSLEHVQLCSRLVPAQAPACPSERWRQHNYGLVPKSARFGALKR